MQSISVVSQDISLWSSSVHIHDVCLWSLCWKLALVPVVLCQALFVLNAIVGQNFPFFWKLNGVTHFLPGCLCRRVLVIVGSKALYFYPITALGLARITRSCRVLNGWCALDFAGNVSSVVGSKWAAFYLELREIISCFSAKGCSYSVQFDCAPVLLGLGRNSICSVLLRRQGVERLAFLFLHWVA